MDQQLLVDIIVQFIIIGAVATALMGAFGAMTIVERRLLAKFTMRMGPNRVGPYGSLQLIADGLKMFFKEEVIPNHVDSHGIFDGPRYLLGASPDGRSRCANCGHAVGIAI